MLHEILNSTSFTEMEQMFRTGTSSYWENHYRFGRSSPPLEKRTGARFILSLMINTVVPFLCTYAEKEKKKPYVDLCMEILRQLEAESNHIIKKWSNFGIRPANAFESQAKWMGRC